MQKLTRRTLHTQIPQPMPAHHRPQPRIILGGSHLRLGLVSRGEYRSCLAVGEGVDGVRDSVFEDVFFEIELDVVQGCWYSLVHCCHCIVLCCVVYCCDVSE